MEISVRIGRGRFGEYGLRLAAGAREEEPVLADNGRIDIDGSRF